MAVGLKSWMSREWSCNWSCTVEQRSRTNRVQVRSNSWSGNLGDRDGRVDLIGNVSAP